MSAEAVARRYAKALFELAVEAKNVQAVNRSLADFVACYEQSVEFQELDQNPALSDAQRGTIVGELGSKMSAPSVVTDTVIMLAHRQRLAVLPDMLKLVEELADEHLGVLRADVRAATKLSQGYLSRLKSTIEDATGKKVVLHFEVDPTLIAGVVTQIGDRVIDGSVRGKLDRLAASLQET